MVKKVLKRLGQLVLVLLLVGAGYVGLQAFRFSRSMAKVYDVPVPSITRSTDPAVIERGRHLASSVAACATADCHGTDLGGGKLMEVGPLGRFQGPNITSGGRGASYSDGEIARLVTHGLKRDGRSVTFMPSHEINWLPDEDLTAIISFVRTVPAVDRPSGPMEVGLLAKVLDRHGMIPLDIARRIDHQQRPTVPAPSASPQYGAFLARACTGCHGERLSGGRIPGAPSKMAIPANLTPHETGLKTWTFADFEKLLATGTRPDGRQVDKMMPYEALSKMNDVEKQALWAYLQSVPAAPFGGR